MSDPYFIEVYDNGCTHCASGRTWIVVGPDDVNATSQSWDDEAEAAKVCDWLNEAYHAGENNARSSK